MLAFKPKSYESNGKLANIMNVDCISNFLRYLGVDRRFDNRNFAKLGHENDGRSSGTCLFLPLVLPVRFTVDRVGKLVLEIGGDDVFWRT